MERTPSFQVTSFGNYYLLERMAVGGMAEIFKAKQVGVRGFEKIIVIKRILQHLSEDPEFVEMFEDEAKIAAQLNQANIVQIYELGEVDQNLYITMELVDGKNLRDVTRAASGRGIHLSVEQSVMLISEVLKGLDYAHRKTDSLGQRLQIIHRDMSPQNIIVSYEGEAKILDFGIAKAASKISKTEAGVLKGKFSYMSPEQASGKPIDQTSDIYAVGVILHELLTSDRLFRSKTDMETLEKVKEGLVPPPSERNPLVSKKLDAIVLKALSKDVAGRYQTAGEMLQDLIRLSYDEKFAYGSHELSLFMKTLFAESIKEERVRLQEALSRIPANPIQQIKHARTHIAFKRNLEELPVTDAISKEGTRTVDVPTPRHRRGLWVAAALTLGAFAVVLSLLAPKVEEPVPSPQAPLGDNQKTDLPEIPKPTKDSKLDAKLTPTDQNPEPSIKETPSSAPPPVIETPPSSDSDLVRQRPNFPSPRPVKPKKPIEPPPASPSPPAAKAYGRVNIRAPQEGFANLSIDNQPRGTVPGPNARNIQLSVGKHRVKCETTSKVYEGSIEVKENQELTVGCSDLR